MSARVDVLFVVTINDYLPIRPNFQRNLNYVCTLDDILVLKSKILKQCIGLM